RTGDETPSEDPNETVGQYSGQIQNCYDGYLASNPDLAGRVEAHWKVSAGVVSDVAIISNTTGSTQLAHCIETKIQGWKFHDSIKQEFTWPFIF
ncbi:MAG: AgmX/PglI C-terminal domain-containing protein, partial [Proteobacteria bacterium]|nr:AgmX/PglI C-terminal domain-containing protein [Pseudomonadota bacterium]